MRAFNGALLAALPLLTLAVPLPAGAQMVHPPGMSHGQVVQTASAGGPDFISQSATVGWIDSAGAFHQMRAGTNGFTCVTIVPDPLGGPVCGDQVAVNWLMAFLTHQPQPPAANTPGIAYMARGGTHYEDAQGNILVEHDLSPHAPGSRAVREQAHWMIIWPFDPATTGLPTRENGTGSYIMYAGTPWAHVMVYQDPNQMRAPPVRR